jgi:hypothetical protein
LRCFSALGFSALEFFIGTAAIAQAPPPANELEFASIDAPVGMEQVTAVSQLTDVKPTDWAFQAVRSLVERYGCLGGYGDLTFRGQRSLTRDEFAAGLAACLDKIQDVLTASTQDLATPTELEAVKKLLEEFAPELAVVRGRLDVLEVRSQTLKTQVFSPSTKLFGQVVWGLQAHNSPDLRLAGARFNDQSNQINQITNVQLSFYAAFRDRTLLFTGLQAGSGRSTAQSLTNDLQLGYEADTGNTVQLSDLTLRQLVTPNFAIIAGPQGVNLVNVFRGANRIESIGHGPLSAFAQRNPILNLGSGNGSRGNAGVGFDWQIGPRFSWQGVYFANRPNDPGNGGLFGRENSGTTLGTQFTLTPVDPLDIAIHYAHSYSPSGFLGTGIGDDQVALPSAVSPFVRAPIQTNAIGGTISWRISPQLTVGGWLGYTHSVLKGFSGSVETLNWMAFLNLPDLLGPGNLAGLYLGQPPRILHSDLPLGRNVPDFLNRGDRTTAAPGDQPGRTTHLELFYRYRINDNLSLTPGLIVIFQPNHNPNNAPMTLGILRTTFTF